MRRVIGAEMSSGRSSIGIVGLGLVGQAIAQRLRGAGFDCIGHDLRPQAVAQFIAAGHQGTQNLADLAKLSPRPQTVVLAVFDTTGVLDVVQTLMAAWPAQDERLTLIDCSTGDPEALGALAQRLHARGIGFIEAPLSGSSAQIAAGEATLLLGGSDADIAAQAGVLDAISAQRIHVGGAGMGARAKLATNLVLGLNRAALAEGMVFAERLGIAPSAFLQLVLATPARSQAAVTKGAMMVDGQFEPQSRIRQHLKDVQLMLDAALGAGQRLPLSQAHAALMRAAVDAGDGDLDNAAIIRQIRREGTSP